MMVMVMVMVMAMAMAMLQAISLCRGRENLVLCLIVRYGDAW